MLKMLLSTLYCSSHWLYLRNFPQQLVWCKSCVFTVIWCSELDGVTGQLSSTNSCLSETNANLYLCSSCVSLEQH